MSKDSFNAKEVITVGKKKYTIFNIKKAAEEMGFDYKRLPFSLRVVFENLLRFEDEKTVKKADIKAIEDWLKTKKSEHEIQYSPARVLMQDFTGVPAVVDLAAMRDAMKNLGGDPKQINPLNPVDLVIDHSVQVDFYGNSSAFAQNVDREMKNNEERYKFLRWGQKAFNNFRVVPPGTGICHQVNLEYLAKVVWTKNVNGEEFAYPDTLVGTDSHTTMINGLAVLGWGVGGIEAEAVMLGQPMSMVIPDVIGFRLSGKLKPGTTATDLVLTATNMLRKKGVVNKFVEFYGPGLHTLPVADRATLANMAPEYGATCGFFPVDEETIKYMELTGRDKETIDLVIAYAKETGFWHKASDQEPEFTDLLELDMSTVEPSIAGPKRPQDKILLSNAKAQFAIDLDKVFNSDTVYDRKFNVEGQKYKMANGDVVIAAITSCTNTSNPSVMIGAGLMAKKAVALGLKTKPWVKTSLAPGSKVVTEYLEACGLQKPLDQLGFQLVGYGCTTCIGNSGPLKPEIEKAIHDSKMIAASVLSGNRNFEGRIHPLCHANYLASPPLVVAYALAGNMHIDITKEALGETKDGKKVYLKDIWPDEKEIQDYMDKHINAKMFKSKYADVFAGDKTWQAIKFKESELYTWEKNSTYINNPPYFEGMSSKLPELQDITDARLLGLFGDSITTDHISPAGSISKSSPAAKFLVEHGVEPFDFNSYGSRRGNHEIMMRGTFANIRIKNEMAANTEGGVTVYLPSKEVMSIYDAAMKYKKDGTQLIIIAGKEYGTGSSRDWAAKGTNLLGVKAVIAESFERIHRSNLVGMGVMPLVFMDGMNRHTLNLKGNEKFDIVGLSKDLHPRKVIDCVITYADMTQKNIKLLLRIDTEDEVTYILNGGILHNVIRNMIKQVS